MAIRSNLRWLLAGTVALSALALWWPDPVSRPAIDPHEGPPSPALPPAPAQASTSPLPAVPAPPALPAELPATTLDTARFDPFAGAQPPPPPPPKPVQVVAAPVAPPPPPAPPALNYRYLGRMTDPSGTQRVYLTGNDTAIVVQVGTRLDEGYVVKAFEATGVRLHYPPLDVHAVIPMPAVQDPTSP